MSLLLTLLLSAVCCVGKARLAFLAFIFFHCPSARGTGCSPLFKLQSAVLQAPRKRLEGGPGRGAGRGPCETPPRTVLHSGAKSLPPEKTAFQRRAAPVPPCLRPRVRPPARRTVPEEGGGRLRSPSRPLPLPLPRARPAPRAPEAPTGDGLPDPGTQTACLHRCRPPRFRSPGKESISHRLSGRR